MSNSTLWTSQQTQDAFLRMVAEDGASPRGQLPPAKYVDALRAIDEPGRAADVAKAHANNKAPPKSHD